MHSEDIFASMIVLRGLCCVLPWGMVLGGGIAGSEAVGIYPVTWPFSVCSKEAVAFPVSSAVFGVAYYVTSLPVFFRLGGKLEFKSSMAIVKNFQMWESYKENQNQPN